MPASGTQTILVVDNYPEWVEVYTSILRDGGYNVISAWNGSQALEQARVAKPGLIFMHARLGSMDGYEVCRRLKNDATAKDIPVILTSGAAPEHAREDALRAGAEDYLEKSHFSKRDMLDMIDSALRRRRLGIH